jgi:hypothetical protein
MKSPVNLILNRVVNILQDAGSVRWTADELVMWLNEAQVQTATLRPDATATKKIVALPGGNYFTVDELLEATDLKALRFMRLIRNTAPGSKFGVIRSASMTAMDAILPSWRSVALNVNIINYLTDPEDHLGFYVYPPAVFPQPEIPPVPPDQPGQPAILPAIVELMYSAIPEAIAFPGEGTTWLDIEGTLTVETVFDTAIVDYILARAFSKDSEYGGNGQRAAAHFSNYQQALGYESDGSLASKTQKKATA